MPEMPSLDEIMKMSGPRSFKYLFSARLGIAVGNIVINGIVKQHTVLRNNTYRRSQAALGDIPDILSIYQDAPAADIVKAKE